MSDELIEVPASEPPVVTPGAIHVMEDGVLRDATPAEIAEIYERANPAPVVPDRIPMLNAHLELVEAGWMPAIRQFIEEMLPDEERALAQVYWDKALTMERNHPLVLAIPAAIGKTPEEVDELFIRAAARPD